MKLGEYIRDYREEHGISQRQFAKMCGLTSGTVSLLERGFNPQTHQPTRPTLDTYRAVARAVGLTLDELLLTIDDIIVVRPAQPPPTVLDRKAARVAELYKQASERDRDIIDRVLDSYS